MNPKYHAPIIPGKFYHMYNRANSQHDKLFYQERNYAYFLKKWSEYLHDSLEVWSYCLLPNHFHFLVRVKPDFALPPMESWRRFSIAYTNAINKQQKRRGSLFQEHPKHLLVESETHLLRLIRYIHQNPVHHKLKKRIDEWPYCSFPVFTSRARTQVERKKVLELFGGLREFLAFHQRDMDYREVAYCIVEDDGGKTSLSRPSRPLTLTCVSCKHEFRPEDISYTCPECGPLRGTLEIAYDYDAAAKKLTKKFLERSREFTHWRYLPLLPIQKPELIPALAVGWTPLYRNSALADKFGLSALWIKDDGRNPTASLKDRASSVAVVKALEQGVTTVTAASTGNAASSWAAFTALAGLRTVIFVPETAPRAKLAQLLLYNATVVQVRGTYDEAFDLCCRAAEKWGWYNRSTAINPYLGEGKKTAAFEICEQLHWQVPDYVFVAAGDGCIIQGVWKGFKEFHRIGLSDRLPKLIGVQAAGSAPLVAAWEADHTTAEPMEPHTIADSISVGVPRDQVKALRAVRESGGAFIAVADEAILAAISVLARDAGVLAEPAGATAMAGLQKMAAAAELGSGATAVVMVTGHGLKDIDGVMKAVRQTPVVVENSIEAVEQQLDVHLFQKNA